MADTERTQLLLERVDEIAAKTRDRRIAERDAALGQASLLDQLDGEQRVA